MSPFVKIIEIIKAPRKKYCNTRRIYPVSATGLPQEKLNKTNYFHRKEKCQDFSMKLVIQPLKQVG